MTPKDMPKVPAMSLSYREIKKNYAMSVKGDENTILSSGIYGNTNGSIASYFKTNVIVFF